MKKWKHMTKKEKYKAYITALKTGMVADTFKGFSAMMHRSTFCMETFLPIEIA